MLTDSRFRSTTFCALAKLKLASSIAMANRAAITDNEGGAPIDDEERLNPMSTLGSARLCKKYSSASHTKVERRETE